MDLPKAATGNEVQQVFSLSLTSDGKTVVNGAHVSTDQDLLAQAQRSLTQNPDLRAVIQADGAVAHRTVMHSLDILRQAGVSRIAFGVQHTEGIGAVTEH